MKKILIFDENIFSRICSAILELEGYKTRIVRGIDTLPKKSDYHKFGLIITSYPFGYAFLDEIKRINLPTIILTAYVNREIMSLLRSLTQSFCMIKPLDYHKFKNVVREIVTKGSPALKGYSIL